MFKHNSSNKPEDILLLDYQLSCFGSPALDLHYFFVTVAHKYIDKEYDNFVYFYHKELVKNLKNLGYLKKIPTLREFHIDMLKTGVYACNTMIAILTVVLLDQRDDASIGSYQSPGPDGQAFRRALFETPRYREAIEVLLPFYEKKGMLMF